MVKWAGAAFMVAMFESSDIFCDRYVVYPWKKHFIAIFLLEKKVVALTISASALWIGHADASYCIPHS